MRLYVFSLLTLLFVTVTVFAQKPSQDFGLPQLHTIQTVTLSPPYSCRSSEDWQKGYANTALFLSTFSKQENIPDLLFNGACKSDNYLQPGTGFSLIADLGSDVSLDEVSASRAFNLTGVATFANFSKFVQLLKVDLGHVYAVLLNENEVRGLFVVKVIDYVRDEKLVLQYAVKSYQITPTRGFSSEGFDWEKRSN
jgi:hypothetical protein